MDEGLPAGRGRPRGKGAPPRPNGTMVRVSDRFSELMRKVASLERLSVGAFADRYLLPVAEARYRDLLASESEAIDAMAVSLESR